MLIYGLKACDTCRAAAKALPGAEFVDIREAPPGPEVLARWSEELGEGLVNRRSTTWRGLDEAARGLPAAELIAAHPAVMKRPVIEAEGKLWLGWGKDVQAALL